MNLHTKLFTLCAMSGAFLMNVSCTHPATDAREISVLPEPKEMQLSAGEFTLKNGMTIAVNDSSLMPAANYLASMLGRSTGYKFAVEEGTGDINLNLSETTVGENGYQLDVTSDAIALTANDYEGIILSIQTLRQLLPAEIESASVIKNIKWTVPAITVTDEPRFAWRGLMLDVSRHFYTPEEVKELLDIMALYKLNKFHWHLTDDQGWRIEIKQYPLLTEKGAWRKFNNHDRECMQRAIDEHNPDLLIPAERLRIEQNGDTLYGGYYTQEDIREIVDYASVRGIDVIPEIDMPGHFLAAISEYKGVSCSDQPGWGELFSSPVCPGKESAMTFCKNIYEEVFALFPYEYVHLGADEVEKTNWKKCPDCQKRMKAEKLKTEEELQAWFVKDMEQFFNQNGKKMIGWDEIIEGGLSETATVMWWRSWVPTSVPEATRQGNKSIVTANAWLYFDAHQDKRSLLNTYEFEPTATVTDEEQKKLILGVQGNIWCEGIPSRARLQYMMMPRMLALSEISWISPDQKDADGFTGKAVKQFPRLDVMKVNYRIPDINGFYERNTYVGEGKVKLNCPDPSAVIRYTTDGTVPDEHSPAYERPISINETTEFTFRTFGANGKRGDIARTTFVRGEMSPAVEVSNVKEGLKTVWHEFRGLKCDEIAQAPVNGTYITDEVRIPDGVKGNIGLDVTGYFNAPADGIYTFSVLSDDGCVLSIDNEVVVDNDGPHSATEKAGQKVLAKGLHELKALYFDWNGGVLRVKVFDEEGEEIPATPGMFMHKE